MYDPPPDTTAKTVQDDTSCMGCGYNLRTLPTTANCPECNTPVPHSIKGPWLQYSSLRWLEALREGVAYCLLAYLLFLAGAFIGGLLQSLGALIALAESGSRFYGAWLLTTPEPRETFAQQSVTLRRTIRALCLAGLFAALVKTVQSVSGWRATLTLSTTLLVAADVIAYFLLLVHLRGLALRIPCYPLATSTRTVIWGTAACAILAFVTITALLLISFLPGAAAAVTPGLWSVSADSPLFLGMLASGCMMVVAFWCLVVFAVWTVLLLVQYRSEFRMAADQARRNLAAKRESRL
jgi:hypothetical protein